MPGLLAAIPRDSHRGDHYEVELAAYRKTLSAALNCTPINAAGQRG